MLTSISSLVFILIPCFPQGETDKAIAVYAQAIELEPTLIEPRVNLGAQLLKIGRLRDAEAVSGEGPLKSLTSYHMLMGKNCF